MARLTTLKPRLTALPPRLGAAPASSREEAEADRMKRRDRDQVSRDWYYSRRWKNLRKAVWLRDVYTCQKTGVICVGKYPAGNSPVADHIIPHRGDPRLFWEISNIQTVSKEYHDSQKQREERAQWG